MVLRSVQFDDIYFSAQDGLAETHHVFIEGNDLPARWQGQGTEKRRFVIAETGFGTGLNFLAAWKLFEETASAGQQLDFISFEKYPLKVEEIREALAHVFPFSNMVPPPLREGARGRVFNADQCSDPKHPHPNPPPAGGGDYRGLLEKLLTLYPLRVPGFHRLVLSERITLTLVFDDVNTAMPQVEAKVDVWFLDGFKPSTNPDMWSDIVFEQMARLSAPGASFATFTAAGAVKRGLNAAGFDVRKVRGFGRKRDMLVGVKT